MEDLICIQQSNGAQASSVDVTAKERVLANGARAYQAVDNATGGNSDRGRNSGFSSFSRTANRITGSAAKSQESAAKSLLTRAQRQMQSATGAAKDKASKFLAKAKAKAADTFTAPVSAARLVNSKSKKSQAGKRTTSSRVKQAA
ncbi:MAG: hypothetical protein KME15_20045 [Drouetiella hepatica Uher 2000/2452]|jgi:hypothetical protein|uniref:Uncharacterized protein n=1 Tax=Drouetiella hepatica Uher 2000/2452 TaxID=904376 RepID=A0A951QEB8_9CYAN|nr:hypothetical protein [Drouetiella hepatica Uher 2000/2452]